MATSGNSTPATIYDVAAAAGVSIATVSRVLSRPDVVAQQTRSKVEAAIAELDYVPTGSARSLAARHNGALGLVLPELTGPYYSELLMGFEAAAATAGQTVLLMLTRAKEDLPGALRQLAAKVDGLAIFGSMGVPEQVLTSLSRTVPVIVIAGRPAAGVEVVTAENRGSAKTLTSHVIDHGRSRLLFIGDPDSAPDISDRYAGFVDAHVGRSIRTAPPAVAIPFVEAEGVAIADAVAAGTIDADALVCANDELALAVVHRLKSLGVNVPGDVAVVGYDDVMAARYVDPGLTTVRQPVREIGSLVAARLRDRIGGAAPHPEATVLPTDLVVRSSCGCADAEPLAVAGDISGNHSC